MTKKGLISTKTLCTQYEIEFSFVEALGKIGLIKIVVIERNRYIHQDQIRDLEKMIRLHHELNINLEGIDVIFNLLKKERDLRNQIISLKNKLHLYENN